MSANEAVSPLRINKTPTASPIKGSAVARPLSEIGSTERRRNSPSFNQTTKTMMFGKESSPLNSSPFSNPSPRLFWKEQTTSPKGRFGSENEYERSPPPSLPSVVSPKRSSIENLKKASRVKNSSMFAREQKNEYDPAAVKPLERPLASGRPLSVAVQGNAFGGSGITGLRKQADDFRTHRRGESLSKIPTLSPSKASPAQPGNFKFPATEEQKPATSEGRASPTKSSLVYHGRFNSNANQDIDSSVISDTEETGPRPPLRRHAKSVTFDAAPPIINEYELVTPDPSVTMESREGSYDSEDDYDDSFEHGSMGHDDSFDASLEDTEKTPVVLPDDWRHMSPEAANTSLVDGLDDPFSSRDNSPMPNADPNATPRSTGHRHGSTNSEESRPLPPLPWMQKGARRRDSAGLAAAAERASGVQRTLPSPPPAAGISKSDILNMREGSMSLEDRLRLMEIDRRSETPTQDGLKEEEGQGAGEASEATETERESYHVPHLTRESILRRMKSRSFDDNSYGYDPESSPDRSYGDLADLDPDVPIPSREASSNFEDYPRDTYGKADSETDNDSVLDAYSMGETTEVYGEGNSTYVEEQERESSVVRHDVKEEALDDDDESQYSDPPPELQPTSQDTVDSDGPPTPKPLDNLSPTSDKSAPNSFAEFKSFGDGELDLNLDPYSRSENPASPGKIEEMRQYLQRPETPENPAGDEDDPKTPDSVIRHPVAIEPPERVMSPVIPETAATVRVPGANVKTRPSLQPSDFATMAATRRQVSGEHPPPIPERSAKRHSFGADMSQIEEGDSHAEVKTSSDKENLMLDIPIGDISADLSFGLDKEFDNIIEAQKKGYLMRHNTKIVVASNRQFSDERPPAEPISTGGDSRQANNTPRKPSADRKAWTTEPWNGKARRRSIRTTSGARRAPAPSTAPPLPGQESAVSGGLDSVAENNDDEEFEDGAERGRLFVKVVGVKDLDLPLPKTERTWFQLTLDNGLHCVTTSWLELGHSAPIGQEFELVVLDDLEFQLTLQTKLEPPKEPVMTVPAVPKTPTHKKTGSAFRNLLSSPKKRKEQERKEQEEKTRIALRQQQEAEAKRNKQPTAWDMLHNLVGPDGSFARAYVCLKNHESQAYGRPLTVDIPCFNEWAVDENASSVKSKRGGVVRRPPYRVGKLTLQLLYVPKPKSAKDEDMPKSMNACIRELKEAEDLQSQSWEGYLSQQGGDCPYWRRRFFRLNGTKLTAYHEATHQPRATINLAKATRLIDDKAALTQPSKTKSGGRRKSAFADDEEGYMFVEEGFRIRFANGEVIDFYADSAQQKDDWMKVLSETVGKDAASGKAWTQMVLERERKEKMRAKLAPQYAQAVALRESQGNRSRSKSQPENPVNGTRMAPSSPQKQERPRQPPPPVEKDAKHQSMMPGRPRARTDTGKRDQIQPQPPRRYRREDNRQRGYYR